MAEKSVLQKLQLKTGQRAAVLNAPDSYEAVARQIPDAARALNGTFDFIHVFVTRRADVLRDGPGWRGALAPQGILWASYPTGKAIPTDLNRDKLREAPRQVGLEAVSQVAIDDAWSALRAKPI
jgi:hypothetical protein